MVYITQLVYLKEGKEKEFHEFEDHAIPLLEEYKGKILYRIRPTEDSFVSKEGESPYEVHFVCFQSQEWLEKFMNDKRRLDKMHLKNESVKTIMMVKGERM